jgi:hypothetical protein
MTFAEILTHANKLNRDEKRQLLDHLTLTLIAEEAPQLLQAELWRPQIPAEVAQGMVMFMRETETVSLEHS